MAGVRGAFVHLLLTVTSSISNLAVAVVNISSVQTLARITAQLGDFNPSLFGCHLTGDTWYVTIKARPASLTFTAVGGASLPASSPVLTG